jgi:hypothetical protein
MRLGSLRYPIALAREVMGRPLPGCEASAGEARAIRDAWARDGGTREQDLVEMLERAVGASLELIGGFSDWLREAGWVVRDPVLPAGAEFRSWFLDETYPTFFTAGWTPEEALRRAIDIRARTGILVSVLPETLWPHLVAAAGGARPVGRHVSSKLVRVGGSPPSASPLYAGALRRGIAPLERRTRWLEKNGFGFGYTHTYGFRPAAGLRRRLRRSCRDLVTRMAAPSRLRAIRRLPALQEAA